MSQEPRLQTAELHHVLFAQMGTRTHPATPEEHIHEFLMYDRESLPPSPIDEMRKELLAYITKNSEQLSLPCHGECDKHSDGVVVFCYTKLLEELDQL